MARSGCNTCSGGGMKVERDSADAHTRPARFRVWIDEEVQWLGRAWGELEVAPNRELHPIRIEMAEEILARRRIVHLRRVRGVNGNPSFTLHVKLRPAVIAGRVAVGGGERKSDDEARRDSLRPRQRQEQ